MFEYKVLTVKINPGFNTPKIDDVEKIIAVLRFLIDEGVFHLEVDTISLNID